jgi:hypothetical protein
MKKSHIWLLTAILIIPTIILIISLSISDIKIKDFPWWAIAIPVLIIVSPFTFYFAQRVAHRTYNSTLNKRKKILLYSFCALIIFSVILLSASYYFNYEFLRIILLVQILPIILFMFFGNFRLFFQKKEPNEK